MAAEYLVNNLAAAASILTLAEPKPSIQAVYKLLQESNGFLVVSGTYWSNWGSPLQRFMEVITSFENSSALFGKPLACAVTMESVGGSDIAARLHAVFSGLGCWSPPCSTLVVSRVGQEAILASQNKNNDPNEDVWRVDDLEIVLKNLVTATTMQNEFYVSWPHVTLHIPEGPWPETGILDFHTPQFISPGSTNN
ncbi:NAD(P)H-dependent oxidoreductase [Adhaeribacter pallidiroseus]|uniref:NADPH-dependent FMN reductase-like domain-containing protein n=1 Tax=Adhaeribacter pallidiroseus TaxID=2072847 RepID=A0A369QBG4_9BACT|nr:NAD(P)H-dependent oxidoreductase [Adhaeribacter pallidiroseus]RDC61802.1 hypothetical protein AHMF7616_00391 [Adhaeribacter pallidiroseus]